MMFIDPLDLCPTVLYVCVLFPCPEVEGLPQGCNELCTVAVVHVGTSKDVVHRLFELHEGVVAIGASEAEESSGVWWQFDP